jgi:hypothetical protein
MTPMAPRWRDLPVREWADTLETLHLRTQVVCKIRLVCSPWLNHSWSVPLYISARGLRTSLVPYEGQAFEWAFDLLDDRLVLTTTTGEQRWTALAPRTVADFYEDVTGMLAAASAAGPPARRRRRRDNQRPCLDPASRVTGGRDRRRPARGSQASARRRAPLPSRTG